MDGKEAGLHCRDDTAVGVHSGGCCLQTLGDCQQRYALLEAQGTRRFTFGVWVVNQGGVPC